MAAAVANGWSRMSFAGSAAPCILHTPLVFDIEMDDRSTRSTAASPGGSSASTRSRIAFLSSTHTLFESRLLRDVRSFKESMVQEDGKVDPVVLASRLSNVGYRVNLRTAIGGGVGQACFHNLRHEFLLVSGLEPSAVQFVVEPNFQEQFHIPQATEQYEELLRLVPAEFVGSPSRLVPLVQLLCEEMALSFQEMALACPPWRQARSMTSKWLPNKAEDICISSGVCTTCCASQRKLSGGLGSASSPTTPLSSSGLYSPDADGSSDSDESPFTPRSIQSGFQLKKERSLLSSKLATPRNSAELERPDFAAAGEAAEGWQQLPIRKVKMSGARAH